MQILNHHHNAWDIGQDWSCSQQSCLTWKFAKPKLRNFFPLVKIDMTTLRFVSETSPLINYTFRTHHWSTKPAIFQQATKVLLRMFYDFAVDLSSLGKKTLFFLLQSFFFLFHAVTEKEIRQW